MRGAVLSTPAPVTPAEMEPPMPTQIITPPDRFWNFVEFTDTCWLWRGSVRGRTEYGRLWDVDRKRMLVTHRASYEFCVGVIPKGLQIDHLCRVTRCLNPDHLEAVTAAENTRRGMSPTMITHRTDRCQRGHELTADNTYWPPGRPGRRACRACKREWDRKFHAAYSREYRARRTAAGNPVGSKPKGGGA